MILRELPADIVRQNMVEMSNAKKISTTDFTRMSKAFQM